MLKSTLIFVVGIAFACLVAQAKAKVVYSSIDEETGCPLNVQHVCELCMTDQGRFGCYCDNNDEVFVTADVFTACPSSNGDPCDGINCENGGTCIPEGLSSYRCECAPGFGGMNCTDKLPKCSDNDIKCPNAECVETTNPQLPVYCQCFDGSRKNPTRNETCPTSPCYVPGTENPICQNNGTCRIVNGGYVCECASGFTGVNCTRALPKPLCEDRPGICGVGKCVQSAVPAIYSCNCGAFPSTFSKDIDKLVKCEQSGCYASNPCQNGGTCTNQASPGAFTCQCPSRYTGVKCESQSVCFNNPCTNGGTCEVVNATVYFCKCPPYFTGQRCEINLPNPCTTKNCAPYGVCTNVAGVAYCSCNNQTYLNASACQDPCKSKDCNTGVCTLRTNSTSVEAYCACPVTRTGELCDKPTDKCREAPRCGGGYCITDYTTTRGYKCVCEGNRIQAEPCPFSSSCPIKDCGTQGICTETNGIIVPPSTRPIYYVCTCLKGYITTRDCDGLLSSISTAGPCGANGEPYPSRNPNNPIGCWCKNGTHIEEIPDPNATDLCS